MFARHRREEAAAGDHQRLRRQLLGHADQVLDGPVRGGDAAERDHVPAVSAEDLADDLVRGPPRVGVVDLHLVAVAHGDGRQQRLAVRHVFGVILLADERVQEQHLGHSSTFSS